MLCSACNGVLLGMKIPSGPMPPIRYDAALNKMGAAYAAAMQHSSDASMLASFSGLVSDEVTLLPESKDKSNIYFSGIVGYDDLNRIMYYWYQEVTAVTSATSTLKTTVEYVNLTSKARGTVFTGTSTINQNFDFIGGEAFSEDDQQFTVKPGETTATDSGFDVPRPDSFTSFTQPSSNSSLMLEKTDFPDFFASLMDTGDVFVYFDGKFDVYRYASGRFTNIYSEDATKIGNFGAPDKDKFEGNGWSVALEDVVPVIVTPLASFNNVNASNGETWTYVTDILFLYAYTPPSQIKDDKDKPPEQPDVTRDNVAVPAQTEHGGAGQDLDSGTLTSVEDTPKSTTATSFTGETNEEYAKRVCAVEDLARLEASYTSLKGTFDTLSTSWNATITGISYDSAKSSFTSLNNAISTMKGYRDTINNNLTDDATSKTNRARALSNLDTALGGAIATYNALAIAVGKANNTTPTSFARSAATAEQPVVIPNEPTEYDDEEPNDEEAMTEMYGNERPFYRLFSYRKDVTVEAVVYDVKWYFVGVSYKQRRDVSVRTRFVDRSEILKFNSGGEVYAPEVYVMPIGDRENPGFVLISTPWTLVLFDGENEFGRVYPTRYSDSDYNSWGRANGLDGDSVQEAKGEGRHHMFHSAVVTDGNANGYKTIILRSAEGVSMFASLSDFKRSTMHGIYKEIKELQGKSWTDTQVYFRPWHSQRVEYRKREVNNLVYNRLHNSRVMSASWGDCSWDYNGMLMSQRNVRALSDPNFLDSRYTIAPRSLNTWRTSSQLGTRTRTGFDFEIVSAPSWQIRAGNMGVNPDPKPQTIKQTTVLHGENVLLYVTMEEGLGVYRYFYQSSNIPFEDSDSGTTNNISVAGSYFVDGYRVGGSYFSVFPTTINDADCVLVGFWDPSRIAMESDLPDASVIVMAIGNTGAVAQDWVRLP
jgi:hypothetical protein